MDILKKTAVFMSALVFAPQGIIAHAEEGRQYTAVIPVTVSNDGGRIPASIHSVVRLSPVDGAPMPDVSEFSIAAGETYDFGPIVFEEPGEHRYTIAQVPPETGIIETDDRVYHVTVSVFSEEDGSMWGTVVVNADNEEEKADEVLFDNRYLSAADESSESQGTAETDASSASSSESSSVPQNSSIASQGGTTHSEVRPEVPPDGRQPSPRTGTAAKTISLLIPMGAFLTVLVRRRNEERKPHEKGGDGG